MTKHQEPIGVGIVGASPGQGWATLAHVPALQALPEYALRAVATSRASSAAAASELLGVPGYGDYRELIEQPDVDLVVVSVRVPSHHEIVSTALAAGKLVYSEWPLGNGLLEAADLAERAEAAGVRTVVGLQGRFAPAIERARALVAEGYVGELLSTTLVGSGMSWGGETVPGAAYLFDVANGATTLTVTAMHALDALVHVLGPVASVAAELSVGRQTVAVAGESEPLTVTAPDQVAILPRLAGGAPATLHVRGGASRGDNFRWEINGTAGDLVLTAEHGNLQTADLRLAAGRGDEPATGELALAVDPTLGVASGPPQNVALLYRQLARDLREGTRVVPDFADALAHHRLADAIERSARSGQRVRVDGDFVAA